MATVKTLESLKKKHTKTNNKLYFFGTVESHRTVVKKREGVAILQAPRSPFYLHYISMSVFVILHEPILMHYYELESIILSLLVMGLTVLRSPG